MIFPDLGMFLLSKDLSCELWLGSKVIENTKSMSLLPHVQAG